MGFQGFDSRIREIGRGQKDVGDLRLTLGKYIDLARICKFSGLFGAPCWAQESGLFPAIKRPAGIEGDLYTARGRPQGGEAPTEGPS